MPRAASFIVSKIGISFVLAIFGIACSSRPQPLKGEATLAAGIARLQANDSAGAAKILEDVTRREPQNGRAWRNLGLAYQTLKDLDHAIPAYRHALEVDPAIPTPLFNLRLTQSPKDKNDPPFAWPRKANDT